MYPTVTVEHLSSVPTATDDSDDMKIYQFDREASMDWWIIYASGTCSPGSCYKAEEAVLAA
ncbi:hypothetical protein AB0E59_27655 [Lentzea sp. NPDC034063]|uniref:hypothetical protein n=1 Tax=unclassified Lentzea TaxID=2643253 RepID=UPI0033FC9431